MRDIIIRVDTEVTWVDRLGEVLLLGHSAAMVTSFCLTSPFPQGSPKPPGSGSVGGLQVEWLTSSFPPGLPPVCHRLECV